MVWSFNHLQGIDISVKISEKCAGQQRNFVTQQNKKPQTGFAFGNISNVSEAISEYQRDIVDTTRASTIFVQNIFIMPSTHM